MGQRIAGGLRHPVSCSCPRPGLSAPTAGAAGCGEIGHRTRQRPARICKIARIWAQPLEHHHAAASLKGDP